MIQCISFIGIGFFIGALAGLFGVGGGFLLVPLLNAVFNLPYNVAIGSSLFQMVGTSIACSIRYKGFGHIDYKLAGFVLIGSLIGVELGSQILMWLKELGNMLIHGSLISKMDFWISIVYMILLSIVGISMS